MAMQGLHHVQAIRPDVATAKAQTFGQGEGEIAQSNGQGRIDR